MSRCHLNRPPASHGSLRHPSLPGVSLFRRFCCYLDRPPALHGSLRYPSPPGVSRSRRIGSHLRRVTKAPGAPPSRTSPACLVAKPYPEPSPNHGPVLGWDCRREFRQARSRAPLPDSVLTVVGMTDGVWQCGSVMSTLRRGPCRSSRHDRGWWKTPRDPRCDRAETLAEPGIPATAAGILLRHHRNPLPRGRRR